MSQKDVCPKCKGKMVAGNYTGQEIFWEKEGKYDFLKKAGNRVQMYACERCGFIENYVMK